MKINRNLYLKLTLLIIISSLIILPVGCGNRSVDTSGNTASLYNSMPSPEGTASSDELPLTPTDTMSSPEPTLSLMPGFNEIVLRASIGECKVGEVQSGDTNPVIIIPEYHTSVIGQIQSAIALVRLYCNDNLRDIILEGYLKDGPEIDYTSFYEACGYDERIMQSVALKLLSEGEISAAEFMKMVFIDVNIHPTEYEDNYDINTVPDDFDDILNSYIDKIFDVDPVWTNEIIAKINVAFEAVVLEEISDVLTELNDYAQGKIYLTEDELNGMNAFIGFLNSRISSSDDIVRVAEEISNNPDIPLSAMIIGAAHEDGILEKMSDKSISYAVLTPLIFFEEMDEDGKFHKSDMDFDIFLEKGNNESVLNAGIAKILNDILNSSTTINQTKITDSSSIKPQPIINKNPMVRGRAELYTHILRIMLGSGEDTLNMEKLDGEFFMIDLANIETIVESNGEETVFFEVNFKDYDESIYVKAHLAVGSYSEEETPEEETLEQRLIRAREQLEQRISFIRQAENDDGIIRMGAGEGSELSFAAGPDRDSIRSINVFLPGS